MNLEILLQVYKADYAHTANTIATIIQKKDKLIKVYTHLQLLLSNMLVLDTV